MLSKLLFHFQIRRKLPCSVHTPVILLTVILTSLVLILMLSLNAEELTSMKNRLLEQRQNRDSSGKTCFSDAVITEDAGFGLVEDLGFFNINWKLSRWDSKYRYKFLDFVVQGDKFLELSKKYTVSVATQSSLERMHSIVDVSQHWTGPISLAVFIEGEEFILTKLYIKYLRHCFSHVKNQISFHLAYSRDYPPVDGPNLSINYKQNCSNPKVFLSELLEYRNPETIRQKDKTLYPQNHMRNQARRNCQTDYIYLIDVDIIPSIDMADNLEAFLRNSQCEKLCAYVIPVYEIDEKAIFPQNKSEMLKLTKNKMARPFHLQIFAPAQYSTNYNR